VGEGEWMSRVKCFVVFDHIGNAEKNYFFFPVKKEKKNIRFINVFMDMF
jgi:hypothetical protein